MNMRLRLTLFNTFLLTTALIAFGVAVFYFLRTALLSEIDASLEATALQIQEEMRADLLGETPVLLPPDDLDFVHPAMIYVMIIDEQGQIVARSGNIEALTDVPLDYEAPYPKIHYNTVVHANDLPLRVVTAPIFIDNDELAAPIGYLQVARVFDSYRVLEQLRLVLFLTGLAIFCAALFLGAWLTNNMVKPLDTIAAVALQITHADDLSRRLPDMGRSDEIGRLTLVLNRTLERVERLFRVQRRFLADISHELRTPLTTIRGHVDLMRHMGGMADPETLDIIEDEVSRMTRLVEDLMLLARADAGGLPIQKNPVALDTVFLDVYRRMSSVRRGVELVLGEVDQVCVLGDAERLRQMLINLVDNAIKYTPADGRVTMALSQLNGAAQIVIADTGVGIAKQDLPLIFERFYRVDKARCREQGGSGLGLSIVRWVVEAHGGKIDVESEVGEGTVFTISLPALDVGNGRLAERAEQTARLTREA